jgi:hypothetical protein
VFILHYYSNYCYYYCYSYCYSYYYYYLPTRIMPHSDMIVDHMLTPNIM